MSDIKKSDFAPTVDPDASEAPAELVEFAVSDLKKSSVFEYKKKAIRYFVIIMMTIIMTSIKKLSRAPLPLAFNNL